jgi:hypothetical protein
MIIAQIHHFYRLTEILGFSINIFHFSNKKKTNLPKIKCFKPIKVIEFLKFISFLQTNRLRMSNLRNFHFIFFSYKRHSNFDIKIYQGTLGLFVGVNF